VRRFSCAFLVTEDDNREDSSGVYARVMEPLLDVN
jgi:hypothetical protein